MRMERTVKAAWPTPERAKELLVRQDAEWRKQIILVYICSELYGPIV